MYMYVFLFSCNCANVYIQNLSPQFFVFVCMFMFRTIWEYVCMHTASCVVWEHVRWRMATVN